MFCTYGILITYFLNLRQEKNKQNFFNVPVGLHRQYEHIITISGSLISRKIYLF